MAHFLPFIDLWQQQYALGKVCHGESASGT